MFKKVRVAATVVAPGAIIPAKGVEGTTWGHHGSLTIVRFKLPFATSAGGTAQAQEGGDDFLKVYLADDEIEFI